MNIRKLFNFILVLLLSGIGLSTLAHAQVDEMALAGFGSLTGTSVESVQNSEYNALPSKSKLNITRNYQPVAVNSDVFGAQLFRGAFSTSSGSSFNENYVIQKGDNIQLRMWGPYQFAATLTVDAQGNIFIPNIGPVKVAGVNNGRLQSLIQGKVRSVYRDNVGVYAALEEAQPVKVFVTGFVNQPGYYGGIAADSVLSYLDRAGGVDAERGSYVDVEIRRGARTVQRVNLYDFLLAGKLSPFAFKDGDIVVVGPRKHTFSVEGSVFNPYHFEFDVPNLTVARALKVARVKPEATHFSVVRMQGTQKSAEYYPIDAANQIQLFDGDKLTVTSDRYQGTIQVRVEGAHAGEHALVLPYGATLAEVVEQVKPNQLSNLKALQLYRSSVANRQKEMLNVALDKLEEAAYAANSTTKEEASLRQLDAQLISKFVEKARGIEPKGQVIITSGNWQDIILEQGDVVIIPEETSVIMVHGEVMFPNALSYKQSATVADYINQVGGYTDQSDKSKVIIIHANGEAERVSTRTQLERGDEIMVLPKIETKRVEVARGLSQIVYQIAVAAKVILDL